MPTSGRRLTGRRKVARPPRIRAAKKVRSRAVGRWRRMS